MIKNTYSKPSQPRSSGGRSDNNRSDNRRHDGQRDHNRNNSNNGNSRVNPREQHQKYLNMAREAISAGNHVQAEEFYQHAEHFYRVMNERNNALHTSAPQAPRTNQQPAHPRQEQPAVSAPQGPPAPHGAPTHSASVPQKTMPSDSANTEAPLMIPIDSLNPAKANSTPTATSAPVVTAPSVPPRPRAPVSRAASEGTVRTPRPRVPVTTPSQPNLPEDVSVAVEVKPRRRRTVAPESTEPADKKEPASEV